MLMNSYYYKTQVPFVTLSKQPRIIQPSTSEGFSSLSFSNMFLSCKLSLKKAEIADTIIITLSLPKNYANLRVTEYPGLHFALKAKIKGEEVVRFYTPIDYSAPGKLTFLVKKYKDGIMGNFLHSASLDSEIFLQGPLGNFTMEQNQSTNLILFAAGTGITPIYSVIKSWRKSAPTLVYSVSTDSEGAKEYALKDELEKLEKSGRLKLVTCADRLNWEKVALAQLEGLDPRQCQVLVCGPNVYMDNCLKLVISKGVERKNTFAFGFDDH
jgi:ferredoxin-NADP reductase